MDRALRKLMCLGSSASRCCSTIWTGDRHGSHLVPLPFREGVEIFLFSNIKEKEMSSVESHTENKINVVWPRGKKKGNIQFIGCGSVVEGFHVIVYQKAEREGRRG